MSANSYALQQSYDRIAEEYARQIADELEQKPIDRALLDCFAEMAGGQGPVADIGCGPGHVGRYLHDRGLSVTGIDLSPGMIEVARRLNPDMTFEQGSMLNLPAPDAIWAGIVAFYSIIHIEPENLPTVFAEFRRTLMPGGMLLIAFHLGGERIHRAEWWGYEVNVDAYHFDREVVERAARDAGFEVLAHLEREPNEEIEYATRRAYVLARTPDAEFVPG
jgi:SAM-dependent methyltransferase